MDRVTIRNSSIIEWYDISGYLFGIPFAHSFRAIWHDEAKVMYGDRLENNNTISSKRTNEPFHNIGE